MSRSPQIPFGLCLLATLLIAAAGRAGQRLELVVDAQLPAPAARALSDLTAALQEKRIEHDYANAASPGPHTRLIIGVAGQSPAVDRLLRANDVELPSAAESLCVAKVPAPAGTTIVFAGRDGRGLSYALLDAARGVALSPPGSPWLDSILVGVERPLLRHRSVTIHLANRDLEGPWYFDEAFWRDYFAMLARHRYNNFTLTFADQMNYLNPVYAHLVDVPGFEEVRASDVTAAEKRRNLRMLRRIGELADERGLDFTFGVWTQQPVEAFGGEITVTNMPRGRRFMQYCAAGLTAVLRACPAIDAVQFRMNAESGIEEDEQTAYYQSQFDAIRNCGRPLRLELRYKGLRPETIRQAVDTGLDLTVSTKFWCEHLGLPYHPTAEDTHYRQSRYGYGAMLAKPRDYRVIYRLWTVGSQRLLLWADPDYAARFAHSCRLGDGEGFEIFAPLTNKGYENAPGTWRIFADRAYESYRWEQQRYWFFYLVFGRLGYNPRCAAEVWRRELRQRFAAAAGDVENAYRHAAQILPLVTATRMPSASEWRWWPEMDTGGPLQEYLHTAPSDTAQFYGIRTWKPTSGWWREPWDEFPPGFVEDALAGNTSGRWTPPQVSRRLDRLAEQTLWAIENARARIGTADHPEFNATQLDLRVSAYLAQYHAAKTRAATELAFFQVTGASGRLTAARDQMQQALAAWQRIVVATDGVYHDNLVFGHSRGSPRSRGGHHHSGHWKDRLPELEADLADLQALLKKHSPVNPRYQRFAAETPLAEAPRVEHAPLASATAGEDLTIRARVTCGRPIQAVRLHFRPLNQTVDWHQTEMQPLAGDKFEAVVPGRHVTPSWDLMYYLEVLAEGGGSLWPSWQTGPPYIVVNVQP